MIAALASPEAEAVAMPSFEWDEVHILPARLMPRESTLQKLCLKRNAQSFRGFGRGRVLMVGFVTGKPHEGRMTLMLRFRNVAGDSPGKLDDFGKLWSRQSRIETGSQSRKRRRRRRRGNDGPQND